MGWDLCGFFFFFFQHDPPGVHLNVYPPAVYNHMDAAKLHNYIIAISKQWTWLSLAERDAAFWGKFNWNLGLEGWPSRWLFPIQVARDSNYNNRICSFHRNSNAETGCMIPTTVLKWLLSVLYWDSTMWTSKLKQLSEIGWKLKSAADWSVSSQWERLYYWSSHISGSHFKVQSMIHWKIKNREKNASWCLMTV